MRAQIIQNVPEMNSEMAEVNRRIINEAGVLTVVLAGLPGCGKTSLLHATIQRMHDRKVGVIVGGYLNMNDVQTFATTADQFAHVNVASAWQLGPHHVHQAIKSLELKSLDMLLIETAAGALCPGIADLGQHLNVGVFSVSAGDDQALKEQDLVRQSALLLLTKADLLPYTAFDVNLLRIQLQTSRPTVRLMEISVRDASGLYPWTSWLESNIVSRFGLEGVV